MVRVGVFAGTNRGASAAYAAAAEELGVECARRGVGIVYGGGRAGLMGVVADAALAAGGDVIGVIPQHLVDREVAHTSLTALEVTVSMHERKARMAELADGFLVLPGGFGTFEEAIEVLTWNQLGLVAKPVVFVDIDGFYTRLFEQYDNAVAAGFVGDAHRAMAQRAAAVTDAVALALAPAPPTVSKWFDLDRA